MATNIVHTSLNCHVNITLAPKNSPKLSISIYDFLQFNDANLGISTEIHYVGYTKNPSDRPLNGVHRGLSDMLYKVSNEDNDFFVYYNLFNVLSVGSDPESLMNYCVANSMIDEIKTDEEGRIIEKALIKYFGTESQEVNKTNEEAELENSLEKIATKNNINSVAIHIEMNEPNELYRFFSRSIKPLDKHLFTCRIAANGVEIIEGSSLMDGMFQTPPTQDTSQ